MNPPQEQTAADEFNPREYFLEMTQDSAQADDDFNAREWFLAGAAEQEAEAAHLEPLLGVVASRNFKFKLRLTMASISATTLRTRRTSRPSGFTMSFWSSCSE
jgi:hypothetical protein